MKFVVAAELAVTIAAAHIGILARFTYRQRFAVNKSQLDFFVKASQNLMNTMNNILYMFCVESFTELADRWEFAWPHDPVTTFSLAGPIARSIMHNRSKKHFNNKLIKKLWLAILTQYTSQSFANHQTHHFSMQHQSNRSHACLLAVHHAQKDKYGLYKKITQLSRR